MYNIFKRAKLSSLITIIALSLVFAIPSTGHAAFSTKSLNSGTEVKATVSPGETYSDQLKISNTGESEISVKISAATGKILSHGGVYLNSKETSPSKPGGWINLGNDTVTIPVGEHSLVPYTITIPEDTKIGEYLGGFLLSEQNQNNSGGLQINAEYGIQAKINVPGERIIDLKASMFRHVKLEDNKQEFKIDLNNKGNVFVPVKTKLIITSISGGDPIDTLTASTNVAPNTVHTEKLLWENKENGFYKAKATLSFERQEQVLTTLISTYGATTNFALMVVFFAFALFILKTVYRYTLKKKNSNTIKNSKNTIT